jgi:hypothetical protein
MIGRLFKLFAYSRAPKTTFAALHPVPAIQLVKTPFDFRTAYAPRIAAVVTALLVGPLAYRVGKRIGAGAMREPRVDGVPVAPKR